MTLLLSYSARAWLCRLCRLFLFCLHFPMLYKLGYKSTSTTPSTLFHLWKPFFFSFTSLNTWYFLSGFRIRYKLESHPKCNISTLIRCRMLRWNHNFILHTKIAHRSQGSPSLDSIKLWNPQTKTIQTKSKNWNIFSYFHYMIV